MAGLNIPTAQFRGVKATLLRLQALCSRGPQAVEKVLKALHLHLGQQLCGHGLGRSSPSGPPPTNLAVCNASTRFSMPVRSLTPSRLRWPNPEQVIAAAAAWAVAQRVRSPSLQRVGLFGSYGRGTAGVGSDLDLLLVDANASGPQHQRLLHWPLEQLPLSCNALVLTPSELNELLEGGSRMARDLHAICAG